MKALKQRVEQRGEGGFTLIELLVVIAILGILAAVVVFAVGGITDKGQLSACKIDVRTLRTAEEAWTALPATAANDLATEAELVTAKLLGEESGLHDIVLTNDGAPGAAYDIVWVEDAKCDGDTLGDDDGSNDPTP